MAEKPVRGMSPEEVALELMKLINYDESVQKDRAYYLKLYAECLDTVSNHHKRL